MSRRTTVMPTAGGAGGRVVATLVALVLLTLVVRDPIGAAQTVRSLVGWAVDMVDKLSIFASALSGRQ